MIDHVKIKATAGESRRSIDVQLPTCKPPTFQSSIGCVRLNAWTLRNREEQMTKVARVAITR